MRRALFALLTICLVAGPAAAGSSGRTVQRTYEPAYVDSGYPQGGISHSNGVTFRTRANERFVSIQIEDEAGLPIPARVTQGANEHPDHAYEVDESFCGSTEEPIAIRPGMPVEVWMSHGTCDESSTVGGWTTGTVTATFSRT